MRNRGHYVVIAILIAMFLSISTLAIARDRGDRNRDDHKSDSQTARHDDGKSAKHDDSKQSNGKSDHRFGSRSSDRPRDSRGNQPKDPAVKPGLFGSKTDSKPDFSRRDQTGRGTNGLFGSSDQNRFGRRDSGSFDRNRSGTPDWKNDPFGRRRRIELDRADQNRRIEAQRNHGQIDVRTFDRYRSESERRDQDRINRNHPNLVPQRPRPVFRPEVYRPIIRRDFDREYDRHRYDSWHYGYRWHERHHYYRSDSSWLPWALLATVIIIADNERQLTPFEYAKKHHTWFYSEEEAYDHFKANFYDKFDNYFMNGEPYTRPWWIPTETYYQGYRVDIEFSEDINGYGFWDPTNTDIFVKYDVWDDDNTVLRLMIAKRYLWPRWESYK